MSQSFRTLAVLVTGLLVSAPFAFSQTEGQGQGQAVVTILPKKTDAAAPNIPQQSLRVEVNGKLSQISNWQPLRGPQAGVELVLLIDDGARVSLGREFDDIRQFVQSLPPNVKIAFAYMQNGRAALSGPFSADHAKAAQQLHLPLGAPGYSASPYFCLSDLAKSWPSADRSARREVIMITDGVDYYHLQYDPEDPYVQAAIQDSVRAHLVVYSIYWRNAGPADRSWYQNNAGQNLLLAVTDSTGGNSYWEGFGNPVSLQPFFDDFDRRINNQYELDFTAPLRGKAEVASLKVKVNANDVKTTAPQKTWLAPAGMARE
ncbi:MAG TPA: hypothetical protein VHZ25_01540 [Acidobacteriaceae bacterium]|jgi:hypothetical protein|nr:hypothetical protein [Acidobacteriaceae bacterium]